MTQNNILTEKQKVVEKALKDARNS